MFNPDSSYRHASDAFTSTDVFLAYFFMVYELGQTIPKGPVVYDEIAEYEIIRSSVHYNVFLAAFVLQVCSLKVPQLWCSFLSAPLYLLVPPCLGLLEPYSTSSPPPFLHTVPHSSSTRLLECHCIWMDKRRLYWCRGYQGPGRSIQWWWRGNGRLCHHIWLHSD